MGSWHLAPLHSTAEGILRSILSTHLSEVEVVYPYTYYIHIYGCFQKSWYPQIIHFNRDFHYKPSILGCPYFWKHPYMYHMSYDICIYSYSILNRFKLVLRMYMDTYILYIFLPYLPLLGKFSTMVTNLDVPSLWNAVWGVIQTTDLPTEI